MTVMVSEIEPNVFPTVDLVDAKTNGEEIEVVFVIRIEGRPVRIRVRLDRQKASSLADKINAAMET